jgi:hypothetical protein
MRFNSISFHIGKRAYQRRRHTRVRTVQRIQPRHHPRAVRPVLRHRRAELLARRLLLNRKGQVCEVGSGLG